MSLPTIQNPFAPAQPTFEDEMCAMCPSMTYQQRLIGFCVCCGCGYALSFMATLMLLSKDPWKKRVTNFAILYVFGNFIAIAATYYGDAAKGPSRRRRLATLGDVSRRCRAVSRRRREEFSAASKVGDVLRRRREELFAARHSAASCATPRHLQRGATGAAATTTMQQL